MRASVLSLRRSGRMWTGIAIWCCLVALALPVSTVLAAKSTSEKLDRLLQPATSPGVMRLAGRTIQYPAVIRNFYTSRDFTPLWTGTRANRLRGRSLLQAIGESAHHGLDPSRYHITAIENSFSTGDRATAELLMTDAFLLQARHRADGILDPEEVAPEWYALQPTTEIAPHLASVARGADPTEALDALWPEEPAYWRLLVAKGALKAAKVRGRHIVIPAGPALRPGVTDPRVPLLRQRLALPASDETLYDHRMADAVSAYQETMGLQPDGLAGSKTLEALNTTPEQRLRQIDANLERWRWLPARLPADHILVNVPAFQLSAIRDGKAELNMPVVVGKPLRPTPAFWQDLKYLVFNPYWEIPETIAVEDKLPELRRDPSRLAGQGVEAARWGSDQMVPVDQIDWRSVATKPFPYRLRQLPGPHNPLGRIKFMLPNDQAVYLHDTPDRSLFERCERGFSSGCVRVANAQRLAEWVLQFQAEAWDSTRIETQITSGETRTLALDAPIPVFIVYFTSYVDAEGTLRFQRDLYGADPPIMKALNASAQ